MIDYKIMHKNYASDFIVAKFNTNINPICSFCTFQNDMTHMFIPGKQVALLWNLLEN